MPASALEIRTLPGTTPYREAQSLQQTLVAQRQNNEIPDTLLLLAHPPTVTFGKAANPANLLLTADEYARRGIELVAADRGGDATFHAPGQLVGYPILHLGEGNRDLHKYVRALEQILLEACQSLGVVGVSRADFHAGIWVGDKYLAAVGVRVQKWVTSHGFALNVSDDVRDGFDTIVPCGVAGKTITTVSHECRREVSVSEAGDAVSVAFAAWHEHKRGVFSAKSAV